MDAQIKDLRVSYVFRCVTKDVVHPEKRYYRESGGKHIALPEPVAEVVEGASGASPSAEPIGEDEEATSSGGDVDDDEKVEQEGDMFTDEDESRPRKRMAA